MPAQESRQEIRYCNRCLYPSNHPLGITFNDAGVCSGCTVHDEKYNAIDWAKRAQQFEELVALYRGKSNLYYDCIIPVTGTGDDFYVVDVVKNRFGLNPLLVTYNTHFNTKVSIRNLARLTTALDCDHILSTVGPDTVKKITRATLRILSDMYWHVLAGSQTFPVQVATKFSIPLIIWGCHGQMDQVGQFSHFDYIEMSKKIRKEHGLRMLDAQDLTAADGDITPEDVLPYIYPSDEQLTKSRVRGIYLNNFFFWNSKTQVEWAIEKFGYETNIQERTHNTYETIYCHNSAHVHDYIKYLKFGYGKATDHACRDIRLKRLTREQGIELAARYDHVRPSNLDVFLEWIGMTESEFMSHIDRHRDPRVWQRAVDGTWHAKYSVAQSIGASGVDVARLQVHEGNVYVKTPLLEPETKDYILTGRQYMDETNFKAIEG